MHSMDVPEVSCCLRCLQLVVVNRFFFLSRFDHDLIKFVVKPLLT